MDSDRFDRLAKMFSTPETRRRLLRLVVTVPLAGGLVTQLEEEIAQGQGNGAGVGGGSGRRHRRKARHRHNPGQDKDNRRGKRKRKGKAKGKDNSTTPIDTGPAPSPPRPGPECLSSTDCPRGQACCGTDTCCAGFALCASGGATTQFVSGPGIPPRGTGSAELSVGPHGNDAAQLRSRDLAGTLLEQISALQYATYVQTAEDCLSGNAPYLILDLAFTTPVSGQNRDLLFFEPVYNQFGQPNIPPQGPILCDMWQTWDAGVGGWWSLQAIADARPGFGTTKTLAEYLAVVGTNNARIINPTAATCGGGLRVSAGLGDAWAGFVGNVNFLDITVDGEELAFVF